MTTEELIVFINDNLKLEVHAANIVNCDGPSLIRGHEIRLVFNGTILSKVIIRD